MGQELDRIPKWRIGQSYDVHPLVENRPLILSGTTIPYSKGLEGHSDADVIYHAVTDAILGALSIGDIGQFFPDTDPRWKNVDSSILLDETIKKMHEMNYRCSNIDVTVICEAPRLASYLPSMKENLSQHCGLLLSAVSIKPRTHEKLGSLGRGEGIAAMAVVMLKRISKHD